MLCIKKKCAVLVYQYSTQQTLLYVLLFFQKKRNALKLTRKLKRQFENAMLDRTEHLSDKIPKDKLRQSSAKTNEIQASTSF